MDELATISSLLTALIGRPSTIIARTMVGDFIVSTIDSPDMGPETAICSDHAYVVERYKTWENAKLGHEKYVALVKAGVRTFTDVEYGCIKAKEITL